MDTIGKKLGLKEKMAYGCGDAASNIIWASTGTFLMGPQGSICPTGR